MDIFTVGRRIKIVRKAQHLTQEKLAEMADISSHYLYEIERGSKTMSIYTLVHLADALNVSIDYLVYGREKSGGAPADYVKDDLDITIESVPAGKRRIIRDLLNAILPYIK